MHSPAHSVQLPVIGSLYDLALDIKQQSTASVASLPLFSPQASCLWHPVGNKTVLFGSNLITTC